MAISYERLESLLKIRKISKTDFRLMTGMSTVTMAKLFKNENVTADVLDNICKVLGCQLSDIAEFVPEVSEERWQNIQDDKKYIVQLNYLMDENYYDGMPLFLYGYAIEGDEGIERRKRCELIQVMKRDNIHIWRLEQTITGIDLRSLICGMEQCIIIEDYLHRGGFVLHSDLRGKQKNEIEQKFFGAHICHENNYYRPNILLIPEEESSDLDRELQPLHSLGEDMMNCESLICRNKRILYCDSEGELDIEKMELIHDFFKTEGFLINGTKDLCRIGDFEVFSMTVDNVSQDELFSIKSEVEETELRRRSMTGYKVMVYCKHLHGQYMIQTASYNSGNPTSFKTYDIIITDSDVVRTVKIPESSSILEVRLFEKNTDSRFQLIGYKKIPLMRDIVMSYHIRGGSQTTLEDKYTRRLKASSGNKGNVVNDKIERYSSSETHMKNDDNDPWRKKFLQVERDFNEVYSTELAESVFFNKGMSAHEDFLAWFKRRINASGINSVWIFDPYIDAESVPRLMRAVSDMGVGVKIITDKNAPSRNSSDRINLLRKSCEGLQEFMPTRFEVYAFTTKGGLLHDRMIIMVGQQYMPIVYSLSNSLDNMGMSHPSVVCKLSREAGKKAAEYYWELFNDRNELGEVETLYKSTGKAKSERIRTVQTEEEKQKRTDSTVIFFNDRLGSCKLPLLGTEGGRIIFPQNITEEKKMQIAEIICDGAEDYWDKLAYLYSHMTSADGSKIMKQLKLKYHQRLGTVLQNILQDALNNDSDGTQGKPILRVNPEKNFRNILDTMGYIVDNPYLSISSTHICWEADLAFEILAVKDFSRIKEVFEKTFNDDVSMGVVKTWQGLIYKIAMILEIQREESDKLAVECIKSEVDYLEAIGMQYFIKRGTIDVAIDVIQNDEHCSEFFRAALIDLQVEDCRRGYRDNLVKESGIPDEEFVNMRNDFFCNLSDIKKKWVESFADSLTAEQLEECFADIDLRSCKDVGDLVIMLLHAGKVPMDEAEKYLIYCFFKKVDNNYKLEEGYWVGKDFSNGKVYMGLLSEHCTSMGRKSLIQKLAAYEKKIVRCLHDVFLRQKNYRKWKCYIDMLIWCYVMRLICQNNWKDYEELTSEDKNRQSREMEIHGLLKKYRVVLKEYSDAYNYLILNFEINELE